MFDKNIFKNEFRVWSIYHPFADLKEVEGFCEGMIPNESKQDYAWLVDESISWFRWRQENLQKEILQESNEVMLKI